ncbi:Olee1-like protein [Linum perenne]
MAKIGVVTFIFLGIALSIISSVNATGEKMFVEGKVYCDPCRVEFPTKISTMLAGARVNLACLSRENNTITYHIEGLTDKTGTYKLPVVKDHEEDLCDVKLMKSPKDDCKEKFRFIDKARVLLTENMGSVNPVIYANPIGYMTATTDPRCAKIMEEMGITLQEAQTKIA